VGFADQLTVARTIAVPIVVVLFAWDFDNHDYWATGVFAAGMVTDWFDGRWARRTGSTSNFGKLVDPIADKLLVVAALIMLVGEVFTAWVVVAIVAREFLVSGLRLAAIERGIVMSARDLAKWKTGAQAAAVTLGGLAAGGAVSDDVARWGLVVALVFTWVSGLDYARVAPALLRGRQPA
jgi:CDP-diacylglycerol--glycerol-3-phosphate 3-phosphatidyltransferase